MTTQQKTLHIYILSDSIGETALKVARASLAQFPTAKTVLHKFTFISNKETLQSILNEAYEVDGLLFMTIVDSELTKLAEAFCIKTGLICYNLIQPFTLEIERRVGVEASAIAGAQYELSEEYFDRIRAIEFCIVNDDGKEPKGLLEAEIIILGISRTGKTPLSMYLGTLGYKVANLPLIPEKEITPYIFDVDPQKIIGLTNNAKLINKHRESRMIEYGIGTGSHYASTERVQEELNYAHNIYNKLNCPVINVADRSIEESAGIILELLDLPIK